MGDSFDFDTGEEDVPIAIPGFTPAVGETTSAGTAGTAAGATTPPKKAICWKCVIVAVVILVAVWYVVFRKKGKPF